MEFKISIIDATPEELSLVLVNLNKLKTGSTMQVESKTENFNLGPKVVPATEETETTEAEEPAAQQEESAPEPAPEERRTRTRRTKEQVEADKKAEKKPAPVAAEEEALAPRKRAEEPSLVERMKEAYDKLLDTWADDDKEEEKRFGYGQAMKILKMFGTDNLADVAPADRSAVILAFKNRIAEED